MFRPSTPVTEPTDQGEQYVIPGAEAKACAVNPDRRLLEMRAAAPMRGRRPQKDVAGLSLFEPTLI